MVSINLRMEGEKSKFVVLLFTSITMVLLTSYGIISSDDILNSQVLRGKKEALFVPRPKKAAQVDNITEIWKQQNMRLHRITSVCKRLNTTRSFTPPRAFTTRFLVNDHDKVLFGFVPKVSCTTWKRVFTRTRVAYGLKNPWMLSKFDDVKREKRLRTYKKVLFVRDPIIRFLSTYLSKFRSLGSTQKTWEDTYGCKILELYRFGSGNICKNATTLPTERPFLNVTLTEFIRFITDLGDAYVLDGLSDHWLPQHIVSHTCEIPYDFIGKYENLQSEAPFVLDWVGMSSVEKFPEIHQSTAEVNLCHEYSKVPLGLIEDLREYYSLDFELFGYDSRESIARMCLKSIF